MKDTILILLKIWIIYIKTKEYDTLVDIKDNIEKYVKDNPLYKNVSVQFDFNPTSGF